MKKILIWLIVLILVTSITIASIGCKETAPVEEEAAEEATEETTEEVTEEAVDTEDSTELPVATIRFSHGMAGEGSERGGEGWADRFEEWLKNYPNLTVEQEIVVGDEMRAKINTDAAAGNMPDLMFYWGGPSITNFVENGLLLDVEEYLAVSEVLKKDDIIQAGWDLYTINDKVWGIPMNMYVGYLVYNKEIFDEYNLTPPTTNEELVEVADVLNANGIVPLNVGSKGGNPGHFWFSDIYSQMPNAIEEFKTSLKENWTFNTENNINTANIIIQQKIDGIFPQDTITNGDWGPSFALYNEGKAGMCYSYPWMIQVMDPEIVEKSVFMDLPAMPGSTVDPSTIVQGSVNYGFMINAESWNDPDKQPYIAALADYVISDDTQKWMTENGITTSVKLLGKEIPEDLDIPVFSRRMFEFAQGKQIVECHWSMWPSDPASQNLFLAQLDDLFSGNVTAEEFVNNIQTGLDEGKAGQ